MSPATSRNLVVDTSVIRSSGMTENPVSKRSREALDAILRICHHVVITDDIEEEWNRHTSRFSRRWRVAMESKRKVNDLDSAKAVEILGAITESSMSAADKKIVEKDLLIIHAVLSSDMIIVTRDDQLRRTMEKYPPLATISSRITWINPMDDNPSVFEHL